MRLFEQIIGMSGSNAGSNVCTPQGLTWSSTTGSSNRSYFPAYGLYDYSVSMFIILASELTAGMDCINGIEYHLAGYSTPYTYTDQTIRLVHTQSSSFGTAVTVGLANLQGLSDDTTVKENFNFTITGSGFNAISFDTPFEWNGVDNILVIHENKDGQWNSGYGWGECLSQGSGVNRGAYYYQDTSYPSDSQVVNIDNRRINMKLTY